MSNLIDVIFKGSHSAVDYGFLKRFLVQARTVRFNFPEDSEASEFNDVVNVIASNTYIDFVIGTDHLDVNGKNVPHVFINLGRNFDEIELLLFFDLEDLKEGTPKRNLHYLKLWMEVTAQKYKFSYFICQMDNGSGDEYYFDSNGNGRLYYEL